jgi:dimethylglycine catabolism B
MSSDYYPKVLALCCRWCSYSGADLVVAGCSNCRDQIMKNLKPKYKLDIEVKYIWEMVADALILEEK